MSLFNNKPTPVRLHKKVSWREKYEVESKAVFEWFKKQEKEAKT